MTDTASDSVLFDVINQIGYITLNRPQVLNALSQEMMRRLQPQLDAWRTDPAVRAVVIRGAGERALCAGGDIRSMYDARKAGTREYTDFFVEEYTLDHTLWAYPKPVVALMDGITMGGGMGLSQAAALRIVTERTRVAMPETGIGLIPDVGATYFLSRLPLEFALYLGLTGQAIHAADARFCGLADLYIPQAASVVPPALDAIDWTGVPPGATAEHLRAAVHPLSEDVGTPPLASVAGAVLHHFSQPGVAAILDSLAQATGETATWAAETLATLRQRSPLSLSLVYHQLSAHRNITLADAFRLEYDLVLGCIERGDLVEGVRALIVDKDKSPRWSPANLAEVTAEQVASFFAHSPGRADHPLVGLGKVAT